MLMLEVRDWLYQGKYSDTINLPLLQRHHIKAILHLAEDVRQPDIETLYIPIEDGEPISAKHIETGINFVLRYQPQHVLIACGAGISRSTSYTAAVLKETEGLSLKDALADIRRKYPSALPHPMVWHSLCTFYGESFNIEDLF